MKSFFQNQMDVGYNKLSAFINAVLIVTMTLYYLHQLAGHSSPITDPDFIAIIVRTIIVVVVYAVIVHTIVAIFRRKEAGQKPDERDRQFSHFASRISHAILITWVIVLIGLAAMLPAVIHIYPAMSLHLNLAHWLLLGVAVTETIFYGVLIVLYSKSE